MRHDAPFLVMRLGFRVGAHTGRRRIAIAYQASTLSEALEWARTRRRVTDSVWIARRGQPAHRRQSPSVLLVAADADGHPRRILRQVTSSGVVLS